MTKDVSTERKILEAAREVFIQQGMAGARMQEIADKAGINKALLHYYFRSKDLLFERVFMETLQSNGPALFGILGKEMPLKEKLMQFVEHYVELMKNNPFMPLFVINEISRNPEKLFGKIGSQVSQVAMGLGLQLKAEAAKGTIRPIEPVDLISSIMGLCVFPVIAKPILRPVFGLSEEDYNKFLERRKKEVPVIIWNYLTDKSTNE
ncbi:TetR/AcrR family transcriptional regulator [Imperialibacter roseus]|uniref:TetR/AcrR family transcriptional regulator n=1 Tax=Imperialibacter roseus TaxID=1324217 RepID=A0ABZ0INA5_9BACT|nr:TetR/AcrR family transcriptional regulator [Imperialibacter roseus]WOK05455.1 TetR/AcrR family transcriptional regulator [Imperialibacter roseus]|tara:strand:- start:40929 stop:41549 length:621 start_codon:yes stop_codon:yes gene_type:complete